MALSGKSKLAIFLAVILVIAAGGYALYKASRKPVPVRTVKLVRGDLRVTVSATTTSTIESEHNVTVSAQRLGTIAALPVKEGDFVHAGQVLAVLDKADVMAQLAQAEANVALAKKRLAQSEAGVAMEKAQSGAAVSETESVMNEAKSNLDRSEGLFARGMVSRQEVDAARRTYDVARARHDNAVAGVDVNKVKAQDVAASQSVVKQALAAAESVRVQLGYCTITSPIDGVISKLPVDLGEMVSTGSVVAEIVDPEDIYVLSTIDEVDVSKLRLGMPVNVRVDALPDKLLEGSIYRISPIVSGQKQETRTFEVRTHFKEKVEFLKPGMSADIEALSKEMKGVLHLPAQALMDREGKKSVYVVVGGKAKAVPVGVGYLSWSDAEIKSGLKEGDIVITTPDSAGLQEGSTVTEMPETNDGKK